MSAMTFGSDDTVSRAKELYRSGRQIWTLCGDEVSRYIRSIQLAAAELTHEFAGGKPIRVVCHDRWSGFRVGLPEVPPVQGQDQCPGQRLADRPDVAPGDRQALPATGR